MATDTALIVMNQDYRYMPDTPRHSVVDRLVCDLTSNDFNVIFGRNARASGLVNLAKSTRASLEKGDRLIVFLPGQLAHSSSDSYLLGVRSRGPDGFDIGGQGLSLNGVLDLAEGQAGAAIVVVIDAPTDVTAGRGIENGLGDVSVPQGVTFVQGDTGQAVRFLRNVISAGDTIADAADKQNDDLNVSGFIPHLPIGGGATGAGPFEDTLTEADYWTVATQIGTQDAYESYLKAYPKGEFIAKAKEAIAFLTDAPRRAAAEEEENLGLTRQDRRAIQANLTVLGFDTNGVDGIFG